MAWDAQTVPHVDEEGLYADFHGHRHTFITNLGKAGVPLAIAQKLARHSDPKLTSNTYTHLGVSDKATAIEALPSLPDALDKSEKGQHLGQQLGGRSWQSGATHGEKMTSPTNEADKPQVLTLTRNERSRRAMAAAGLSEGEGTRTLNHRIDSPVL